MKNIYRNLLSITFILAFTFALLVKVAQPVLAAAGCASSSPVSGAYTVTVCFSSPSASGATLSGNATVTGTVSVTGTSPGVQRMVFYLDGTYLLTDYQTAYTFTLPTTKWVDGSHTLAVETLMRDGFISQRGSLPVSFNNGITTPPVNTNQFQPSSGNPPVNGAPFIVAAGGDGASGEASAVNVANLVTSLNPNLFLYLGDVYEKGSKAEFYNWYGTLSTNFGRFSSITNPTIGNHEYSTGTAAAYFDYWNNVPNYYSYNAGGWHFISLNSNSSKIALGPQSAQYQWLQQDLAANAGACTIVYYHHPLFNIGPEGSTVAMADIWNLMAQNGVDIVLNGHDHTYQRWTPLNGSGQPSSNGITEFVAGAAGHGLQTFNTSDTRVAYSIDTNPTAFGVLLLQLNPNGANFSYRSTNGSFLDSGVIPCVPAAADTQAPTVPGGLSATVSSATRIDLNWSAASDNTGVVGYSLYRNGISIATIPATGLAYSDTTALPQSTYNYSIDAFDLAGNHSTLSAPVSVTTPGMPASLTFPVTADTYVSSSAPTTKYGVATSWRLDSSPDLHAYLRFNVQGLAGTPIVQARLLVYASNLSSSGVSARAVSNNTWDELNMIYTNAPPMGNVLATSGAITSGSWVSLDVTPYITGEGTYSFGMITASTSALSFPSRESGLNAAQLILSFSQPTSTPTPTVTPTATVTLPAAPTNTATPTATQGSLQSLTLNPVADTYVNAGSTTTTYGSLVALRADAAPDVHSYLRFSVLGLGGQAVTSAHLLVYANSSLSQGVSARAVADNTWGETTTNYTNAPALGITLASSGAIVTGTWVTLDVTSYITGEGIYSLGVTTASSTAISFASREAGANAPQLILNLSAPVFTPTPTATPTQTLALIFTDTPTATPTQTLAPIFTDTPTATPTQTLAPIFTDTPTVTPTQTLAPIFTDTPTLAPTDTLTATATVSLGQSLTFAPEADTYVNAASTTTNYGSLTSLRVDASPDVHSYLRFSVLGLGGQTVIRARLLIFANSASTQGLGVLSVADNSWGELTMNYTNAPALGSLLSSSGAVSTGTWVSLDVTPYITGDGVYSFGVITPGSTAISLGSREAGANAPQLIIDLQ